MKGLIIKNISNQYQVLLDDKTIIDTIPLGRLKRNGPLIVGDIVDVDIDNKVIVQVYKRKNALIRPKVANIDQAIIVMSAKDPDFSTVLVDKLLFMIQYQFIEPIIYVSKLDLLTNQELVLLKDILDDYQRSGYKVITEYNLLKKELTDKISVLCGQSGAGKSTLLNKLDENLSLKTQVTSKALGRGKHTTRHCELFSISGGWIADTPGFSSLDLKMDPILLSNRIKDFKSYTKECRFNDCKHINEPDCAVKKHVDSGDISAIRYRNYVNYINSLKEKRR